MLDLMRKHSRLVAGIVAGFFLVLMLVPLLAMFFSR